MSEPVLFDARSFGCQQAALNALLADGPQGHYIGRAPRAARRPYLLYRLLDEDGHHHLRGVSGIGNPTVQVEAWADTMLDALRVADAVRTAFDGATGLMAATAVRGCFLRGRRPVEQDAGDGSDAVRHAIQQDFELWHAR